MAEACSSKSGSNRITLDLNLGTAHLMDVIEGPAGYRADSVLIRYQAPCANEDQDVEGDNMSYYFQDAMDDNATVKSSSTASTTSSLVAQQQHQLQQSRSRRRRRRQLKRQLDDQIWFVVASLERFAHQFRHLSLRFVGCNFPAEALAWLLERVERIDSLHLRVTFHGSLGPLAKALQRHAHLKQVFLDHCRPSFHQDDNVKRSTGSGDNRKRRKQERKDSLDMSSPAVNVQKSLRKAAPPKLASLEPLLDGLAQSKTLRSLTLSHTTIAVVAPTAEDLLHEHDISRPPSSRMVAWNAGVSLSQFIRLPCLEKLCLEHMTEVKDSDLACMMESLQDHHTLKTLSIRQCAVGPLAGQALGRSLAVNQGLQTLDVNIHWWDGLSYEETLNGQYIAKCWETDVVALIQGLQANSALKCLGLYCDNLAYTHNAAVVSILGEYVEASTNELCATALAELPNIFRPSSSSTTSIAKEEDSSSSDVAAPEYSDAPEVNNCALEDVIVGHRSFGLTPEIEFYLNWNRAGRSYFCQEDNASPYDWMDAILNHRDDLSVVYALVSMNPTMFFR